MSGPIPHRSLWLRELASEAPAPALRGSDRADVVIVGGGYTGLWSALRLKEREPSLDVVLLEADICGGGASGRNGGFVLSWAAKAPTLVKLYGAETARELIGLSQDAIREIGAFAKRNQLDADFQQGGWLWTATSAAQAGSWDTAVETCERLGIDAFEELPPELVSRRAGSEVHIAGVYDRHAATVQPAALARGLRRIALERDVRIYEQTPVTRFSRRAPTDVQTPDGRLRADRLILATNAWAADVRELRRRIVVVSSDIVATDPIPERLAQIGWTGGEAITDSQLMIDYYRTSSDERILFGKGGLTLAHGARIGGRFDRSASRAREAERNLRRIYPDLSDVPVTASWSGPIDRTSSGLPLLGRLGSAPNVAYGVGFSGNGVGPAWIAGHVLASITLEMDDEWARLPIVGHRPQRFPPAMIAFLGGHLVRAAVARKEETENRGRAPGRLASWISRLAPAGIEDAEA